MVFCLWHDGICIITAAGWQLVVVYGAYKDRTRCSCCFRCSYSSHCSCCLVSRCFSGLHCIRQNSTQLQRSGVTAGNRFDSHSSLPRPWSRIGRWSNRHKTAFSLLSTLLQTIAAGRAGRRRCISVLLTSVQQSNRAGEQRVGGAVTSLRAGGHRATVSATHTGTQHVIQCWD